ncbi:MAG: hypothetical protein Q7S27_02945 [Nanoarchaeota archaeon]|nr:hypothetical protein [Nanoarchaeota archaeon]
MQNETKIAVFVSLAFEKYLSEDNEWAGTPRCARPFHPSHVG